jgi:hypothetical protein
MQLAFVLTAQPEAPDPAAMVGELERSWPRAPAFHDVDVDAPGRFSLTGPPGTVVVGAMPGAVPNGEAEAHAAYSAAFLAREPDLPAHAGHLVVAFTPAAGGGRLRRRRQSRPTEQLRAFIRVLAALSATTSASGVYWGTAGATHPAPFFIDLARADDSSPFLWSGVSFGSTEDGDFSLLSLGMAQLDLPNLLLTGPPGERGSAVEWFLSLLDYVADLGAAPRDGDTVGRSSDERLIVSHVPSPRDETETVWRVAIPAS